MPDRTPNLASAEADPFQARLGDLERKLDRLLQLSELRVADWLTIDHAALVCDCSYDHVRRAVERGDLRASDIGTGGRKAAYRISRSDLNAWMERSRGGTQPPPRSELKEKMGRYLPGVA